MNPLSLSYYTVPELDPLETIDIAAACGMQHVGMRLLNGQPNGEWAPALADADLRRAIKQRLRDTGITVFDGNSARLIPTTEMAAFEPFLEASADYGARCILATGDDPEQARLVDRFGWLCDRAAAHGLSVQIEFVPWMSIPSFGAAKEMLRLVGRSNLGIAVDALHFARSDSSLADLAATPPEHLLYAQLCDAPKATSADRDYLFHAAVKERLWPGDGDIDLVGLVRALPAGIPIALEIPTETLARTMSAKERVTRAVAATRALLEAAAQKEPA
jgi:sugar phosphate isomerase/epimerase